MNERFRLANTVLRGGRYALWVSLSCAVPMMIYADSFVTLYLGSEFQQAMIVILMFMVIFPFTAPTQLLSMTAIAVGQVREFFIPAFLAQLIGLILMLVSVRLMEEDAIAVTISLALVTIGSQLLYFWTMCLRVTGIRLAEFARRLLVPGYGPALTAAVAWFTLDEVIRPESWLTLTICVICGGSIYLTTLYLLFLEVNERRDLNSALNKLRRALT
jgi:O-antigen/teichoic acid export membrane protein